MAQVDFNYGGHSTIIQCNKSDKMQDILDKIGVKIQKPLSEL